MSVPSFHQRDDVNFDGTVYSDAAKTTKKDVTGATVTGRIGLKSTPATTLEVAGSVLDGPEGEIRIPLTSAQTGAITAGLYDFQAEVVDGSGDKNVVADFKVRCYQALPDL